MQGVQVELQLATVTLSWCIWHHICCWSLQITQVSGHSDSVVWTDKGRIVVFSHDGRLELVSVTLHLVQNVLRLVQLLV